MTSELLAEWKKAVANEYTRQSFVAYCVEYYDGVAREALGYAKECAHPIPTEHLEVTQLILRHVATLPEHEAVDAVYRSIFYLITDPDNKSI